MTKPVPDLNDLRRQAQAKISREPPADLSSLASPDIAPLLEELYTHQVELKMQHEALRQSYDELEVSDYRHQQLASRYQALFDLAPVGYFILDQAGLIEDVNLAGATQLDIPRAVLRRRRLTDFIARDSQDKFYLYRRQLLRTKTKQVCELELVTHHGTHFYGQLESMLLYDATAEHAQIQTALIDITARKKAQALLRQRHDDLEALVAARTAELAQANARLQAEIKERKQAQASLEAGNQRLHQALIQLEAAQQQLVQQERLAAVGQLAAGIAHDFNNILTSIIGYADLMLRDPSIVGTPNEKPAAVILEQSGRAGHLVRQILDFGRKTIRQPRPLELRAFLNEMIRLLRRIIPETIQLQLTVEPGHYWLDGDLTQLQQLITNLAVNARDAMPAGGVLSLHLTRLTLTPEAPLPSPDIGAGPWSVLTISDTGHGIPAEVLPHIFEPFFTTKGPGQGSGLGLAQVYGIVQQHGGDIAVKNTPGEGTSFTIYLPVSPPPTNPLPENEATPAVLPRASGECILVVEDEAEVLQVIQVMLESLNYRVLTAANGQEALALYQAWQDRIAAVLTDKVMPSMGGLALLQALRRENPHVKVILMSGYPLGEEVPLSGDQGATGWLQKPLTLDQLARLVHQIL